MSRGRKTRRRVGGEYLGGGVGWVREGVGGGIVIYCTAGATLRICVLDCGYFWQFSSSYGNIFFQNKLYFT